MSELSDLVDLVLSVPQGLSHLSLPSSGLWSHRRPILLPPSPISSEHISGELSPPPFPRYAFGFCATKSGDIYFCGGRGHEYPSLLYYYSTKDNTVTVLDYNGDNPNPRHYHAMAIVGDNILAVHGGKNLFGDHDADPGLFLFNLVSRKWSRIHTSGDAPGSRHGHSMAVIGTTIFMFGGYSIQDSKYFNELWAFDLRTLRTQPRWELVTPSLTERPPPRNVSVFVPYQNQLILFGGWGEQGSTADIWSFNTNTKRWSQLRCMGDIPPPLSYIVGPVLDDVMYVIGGYDGRVGLNDVFALKIPERKWFRLESINKTQNFERRSTHAAVCIGTKIFVFGGCFENGANTSDMIAVFDTKYVNNPDIHMPERLMELEIEFQVHLKVGEATKENSKVLEFERRLAEVERNKVEMTQENSRLEKRLAEVEEDHKEKKRRDLVAAILKSMSKADSLGSLQGTDAQTMVDFLAEVLESQELFQSDVERRHILHLLRKTAKSAQMFPKRSELRGVRCNLADPINDIGGYGLIYKGIFEGQTVCVKAVRVDAGSGSAAGKIMRAQAGELALLGHVSHPNVIPLYGAFLSAERNPRICIVSPWMENGDLADYLLMFPDTSRIPLMIDVAAGLQFLHGMGVVHADLKARNVLVSHSQRALLADFGVSAIVNTVVGTSTAGDISGTTYWMAPELLVAEESPMPPTQQSDMWGYGCICFEVLTGLPPFIEHYKYPIQLVGAFMRGGVTPLQPKRNGPPIVVDGGPLMTLAERCWNYEPSKRPTAAEAMQLLAELNVEDNRPSMDEELAIFEVVRSKRVKVEIDYRRLLSVVRKIDLS